MHGARGVSGLVTRADFTAASSKTTGRDGMLIVLAELDEIVRAGTGMKSAGLSLLLGALFFAPGNRALSGQD